MKRDQFLKKLLECATNGFDIYEGKDFPIASEWSSVYRFGLRSDLFRWIGFYEADRKTDFIVIDGFTKSGQKLSRAERDRIDAVALVKKTGGWRRRQDK